MLAVSGIALVAMAAGVFFWTLRHGIYRRYPHELFVLVGTASVLGLLAAIERPSVLRLLLLAIELAALAIVVRYFGIGTRFRRGELRLRKGERFPRFTLTDSRGQPFDSDGLVGKSAVLYLFYRGHT